jgi:hypothetical protein
LCDGHHLMIIVFWLSVTFARLFLQQWFGHLTDVCFGVLYNILIEFGVPMKLVRLIKMCLNETYSKVRMGKYLSDSFLSKMV